MLPNHSPLRVAEAFHTLAALHRAASISVWPCARHRSRDLARAAPVRWRAFPDSVRELLALSRRTLPPSIRWIGSRGAGRRGASAIWALGSSGAMAAFVGSLGLGHSFARKFSLNPPLPAVRAYREHFVPPYQFPSSHYSGGLGDLCADRGGSRVSGRVDRPGLAPTPSARVVLLPSPEEAIADHTRRRSG